MKNINNLLVTLLLSTGLSLACKNDSTNNTPTPTTTASNPVNIILNPQTTFQTISGFGGANRMWGTQFLKPAEANKVFGLDENQLGLSIFRVRLASNKAEWSLIIEGVKEAKKYGVKILASPWSPPASLKSNNSDIGGRLLPENYGKFKDHINEFITYMAQNGAAVDVVSIQNEPDIKVTYESCDWTADEMVNFVLKYGKEIKGAKLAAPESFNFNQNFTNALLSDVVAENFDIVAGHIYGGGLAKFPLAEQKKKEIWMTEYLMNLNSGNAGAAKWNTYSEAAKWGETLKMLISVHDAMINNWNAYIWWYLQRFYSFIGDGEEGTTNGEVLKRGFAFSHFSKFIRPNFVRINTELPSSSLLKVTAYKKDNQTVVVILNNEGFSVKNIQLSGLSPQNAVSYTTSETANLNKKTLMITDKNVVLDALPYSITTVVINN